MLPDRVSNPGPLTNESGALPIALRGPAQGKELLHFFHSGTVVCNIHIHLSIKLHPDKG